MAWKYGGCAMGIPSNTLANKRRFFMKLPSKRIGVLRQAAGRIKQVRSTQSLSQIWRRSLNNPIHCNAMRFDTAAQAMILAGPIKKISIQFISLVHNRMEIWIGIPGQLVLNM